MSCLCLCKDKERHHKKGKAQHREGYDTGGTCYSERQRHLLWRGYHGFLAFGQQEVLLAL